MERSYVCNRYPGLSIGPSIHFQKGLFVTDDPALQAQIESHDWWKIYIHPKHGAPTPTPEEEARVAEPTANLGMRGTGTAKAARPAKKK